MTDIDFVISWVNFSDPEWQHEYKKHKPEFIPEHISGAYKDFDILRYWFRGIEQNALWVRKIHFITDCQVPDWLNQKHPKINIVNHKQIFPDESMLPTFNSGAIEMNLDNIPDLSEKFVYFNDDMFLIKPVEPERFFQNNLPKDFFNLHILFHNGQFSHSIHEQMILINKEWEGIKWNDKNTYTKFFSWKYGIKENLLNFFLVQFKFLSLFKMYHHPQPFLKRTFREVKEAFPDEVDATCRRNFKHCENIYQYIFRYWALIKWDFIPYNPEDAYYCGFSTLSELIFGLKYIKNNWKIRIVCFNDSYKFEISDVPHAKKELHQFFESIMPNASEFEKKYQ